MAFALALLRIIIIVVSFLFLLKFRLGQMPAVVGNTARHLSDHLLDGRFVLLRLETNKKKLVRTEIILGSINLSALRKKPSAKSPTRKVLGRGCNKAVEHTPRNQEVVGSKPRLFFSSIFSYFPSPVECP